jgi:hypothetical protein
LAVTLIAEVKLAEVKLAEVKLAEVKLAFNTSGHCAEDSL